MNGGYTNGYNPYKEVGVKTASQGKLIVMLYEGAVQHLEDALGLVKNDGKIEASKIENFGNHIQKVQDIITELQCSLDMYHGGEIAQNLMSLYIWFNKELMQSSISHDRKQMSDVLGMLKDLRDSWVIAAQKTNTPSPTEGRPSISIEG